MSPTPSSTLLLFLVACISLTPATGLQRDWLIRSKPKVAHVVSSMLSDSVSSSAAANAMCFDVPVPAADYDPTLDPEVEAAIANMDAQVSAQIANDNLYGSLSLALVYDGKILWHKGYGKVNMTDPTSGPPTEHTAYRIGSVSKLFTALMMYQLRDQGKVHVDDLLTDVYPGFSIRNSFGGPGPSLEQLASHMGGIPRESPCFQMFDVGCGDVSDSTILSRVQNMSLIYQPGQIPSYSNLGIALLGRSLERLTVEGKWEDWLQAHVLDPLGMSNTGSKFTPDVVQNLLAVGYNADKSTANLIDLGFEAPAGQLYSTAYDLARFMSLLFQTNESASSPVLSKQTVDEWLHPVYMNSDLSGFGHPWEIVQVGNYSLRTKDGDVPGFSSFFAASPKSKVGAIVLESQGGNHALVDALIGAFRFIAYDMDRILRKHQQPPLQPPVPADYIGNYTAYDPSAGNQTLYITQREVSGVTVLVAQSSFNDFAVLEQTGTADELMLSLFGLPHPCSTENGGSLQRLVFVRDGQGKVVSFSIPGLAWETIFQKG